MVMHTGGRVVLSANKAGQIRNMLNQYIVESNSGTYDYVKALAAFSSRDEGALAFKKGEVIAVVPKHDAYTEKVNLIYNSIIGMQYTFDRTLYNDANNMLHSNLHRDGYMVSKTANMGYSHPISLKECRQLR